MSGVGAPTVLPVVSPVVAVVSMISVGFGEDRVPSTNSRVRSRSVVSSPEQAAPVSSVISARVRNCNVLIQNFPKSETFYQQKAQARFDKAPSSCALNSTSSSIPVVRTPVKVFC